MRLRDELKQIKSLLGLRTSWADLKEEEKVPDDSDPMGEIKYACALMLHFAELSCKYRLPIVFNG